MQRITIELLHDNALKLLQQLEKLNILRLITAEQPAKKETHKWAGSLSKETATDMLNALNQSREEWERSV